MQFDQREAAFKDVAVKQAAPESVLQSEMNMALWDGRMADYLASYRKMIEFLRSAKREEGLASMETNHVINMAFFEGGPAIDSLKRAAGAPGAARGFVRQAAIVLAVMGDPSVLRRELPRIEREEAANNLVFARAYALSAEGKTEQAVAALQSIATQDPRQAATYFSIGQVQERGGLTDDAIGSYRRVVDVAPALAMNTNVPMARLALGKLLASKGDLTAAKVQFDILQKQWAHADAVFLPAQELKKIAK